MRMRALGLVLAPILALAGLTAAAEAPRALIVAPGGSDAADGSIAHPLATVDAAVRRLGPAGGAIRLRGGTYHQRFALVGVRGVSVQPYRSEHVVLSGSGLTPPDGQSAMVEIADSRHVAVRRLEITGYRTTSLAAVPIGIWIHGSGTDVRVSGDHVHHLGNDNGTLGSFDINAHGIAAYGDDPAHPITGLRIRGNTVDHLRLGASESVVVNGNVTHWSITRNRIVHDDNIGIDAIGFEETITGPHRYSTVNRARHGLIADNVVDDIRSKGNPAYFEDGGWCDCADGIYVDGGTHIRITRNRVAGNDIGIEVAAENPRGNASHVRVDHNRITGSLFTGITTGGYCDGRDACGGDRTGASVRNLFDHNVLRGNNRLNDGSPEVLIQYFTHDDRFVHNSVTATNDDHVLTGTVDGDHAGTGNVSDFNTFATAGAPQFGWRGRTYDSFAAYRKATGQDRHSVLR